jgi:hypothetical protein
MKLTAAVLVLGALAGPAIAARETNAMRMARGLPPLRPANLFATPASRASRPASASGRGRHTHTRTAAKRPKPSKPPHNAAACPTPGKDMSLCCADAGTPGENENVAAALELTGRAFPAWQLFGADCYASLGASGWCVFAPCGNQGTQADCRPSASQIESALCCASFDGNVALGCEHSEHSQH